MSRRVNIKAEYGRCGGLKHARAQGSTVKMPGDAAHIGVRPSLYIRGIPENVVSNEIQNEMQVAKFRMMRNRGLC